MPKANLTRRTFVELSVRWRSFDRTVQAVKDRNARLDLDQIQDEIDQAVHEVRHAMAGERSQGAAS
jgi:hypothetical protein